MSLGRRGASYGSAVSEASISVTNSATSSLAPPQGAISAVVSVSGGTARYAFKSAPSPTVGHVLLAGGQVEVFRDDLVGFRIIAEAAGGVTAFVTYYQ